MQYFDATHGQALKDAFDAVVLDWPGVTSTTMFGCPSYRAGDTLFAVLVTDGVVLTNLPEEQRDAIDATFDREPFQAGDRTVTKWVQVTLPAVTDLPQLVPQVRASYEAALTNGD